MPVDSLFLQLFSETLPVMGSIFGTGGALYYVLHQEIDSVKSTICRTITEHGERISRIEGQIGKQN